MSGKKYLKDVIFLLPGIQGSVLRKDNKDIWSIEKLLPQLLKKSSVSFNSLYMSSPDDGSLQDIDGVKATSLLKEPYLLGFTKSLGWLKGTARGRIGGIRGYSLIEEKLVEQLDIKKGELDDETPANYFEFPYDWRRNNAFNARELKKVVDRKLKNWKESSGVDSKAIFIAHSMGGLICRYYLEVEEGWRKCRALFTMGTPFHGSAQALESVCNGDRIGRLDLSHLIRSFTSSYQLLPTYTALGHQGVSQKISDISVGLPNVEKQRFRLALDFHGEIEKAVRANKKLEVYRPERGGYYHYPIVGIRQQTTTSAIFEDGKIKTSGYLLDFHEKQNLPSYGDGTVPQISAVPKERFSDRRATYLVDQHAALQLNEEALIKIVGEIKSLQVNNSPVLGETKIFDQTKPTFSLDTEDSYEEGAVVIKAVMTNDNVPDFNGKVTAFVQPIYSDEVIRESYVLQRDNDREWTVSCNDLKSGMYDIRLLVEDALGKGLGEVNNLFLVG